MPSEWESTRYLGYMQGVLQEKENSALGGAQEHECGSHDLREKHTWLGAEESQRGSSKSSRVSHMPQLTQGKGCTPATTDLNAHTTLPASTTLLIKGAIKDKELPCHLDKQQSPVV